MSSTLTVSQEPKLSRGPAPWLRDDKTAKIRLHPPLFTQGYLQARSPTSRFPSACKPCKPSLNFLSVILFTRLTEASLHGSKNFTKISLACQDPLSIKTQRPSNRVFFFRRPLIASSIFLQRQRLRGTIDQSFIFECIH